MKSFSITDLTGRYPAVGGLPRVLALSAMLMAMLFVTSVPIEAHPKKKKKEAKVLGWIEFKPHKKKRNHFKISAKAHALKAVSGSYVFSIRRKGRNGIASSNQSGKFNLRAGQSRKLSQTVMNIPRGDAFQVGLKFMVGDKVVFSAVLDNKL